VPRHPGLVDVYQGHQIVHRPFALPKRLDDETAGRVGQRGERIDMWHSVYIPLCIYGVKPVA